MAFYQNAPKKRVKVNYADTGSWDEEGTHYRGRDKNTKDKEHAGKKPLYRGQEEENRRRSYRKTDEGAFVGKDGGGPRRSRDSIKSPFGNKSSYERIRNTGSYQESKGGRERKTPDEYTVRKSYRDYEYRRPAESFSAQKNYRDSEFGHETDYDHREDENMDRILCGRNPIREAPRSGREIEKLLVQKGELSGSAREIVQNAREQKIMVQEVDKHRLDEIAPHHQGLIAFASPYPYADVEEILEVARSRQEDPFLILLDGVTDPHNLGAIIRTAECVGAHGVVIPQHRSVGLTPAAVKASAGAVEHIKIAKVVNLNRTIDELKKAGVWTYAVTMDGKDYEKVDFHGGTALVIGAEGEGISRLTAEKCDLSVSLPMRGSVDSLNASVAAGVILYRVLSCRRKR